MAVDEFAFSEADAQGRSVQKELRLEVIRHQSKEGPKILRVRIDDADELAQLIEVAKLVLESKRKVHRGPHPLFQGG